MIKPTNKDIYFTVTAFSLGLVAVASSEKGICAIFMGDDSETLVQVLQKRFPEGNLIKGDNDFAKYVTKIINFIEVPGSELDFPLDIRGTVFQQLVWQALREIPFGATVSYTDIAKQIGSPKSFRAVAQACGANALAVVIPCHRVLKNNGSLSGYRWGVDRKRILLEREATSHSN